MMAGPLLRDPGGLPLPGPAFTRTWAARPSYGNGLAAAACLGRVAAAEGSMSDPKMRLKAERSLAFAEACEKGAETPAEMVTVLQLERQAMAMLTEAGHADWAMSLRPRFRDILVLVAPDAEPLPIMPPDERPSRSAGAPTVTAVATWHRMGLSPDPPPSQPPTPKHPSAEERRAEQADQPSITPATVGKVLGMPAYKSVELLARHLVTCHRGQPTDMSPARPYRPARSQWRRSMRTNSPG
jgi:hypothetical protein